MAGALEHCRGVRGGRVADYIPRLAAADPGLFAIAGCGMNGSVAAVGDEDASFTVQSIVKPFLLGMALARYGDSVVFRRVGVEPTGQEFDSFTRIETSPHRPPNPMVNAGAIAVVDLLLSGASSASDAAEEIRSTVSAFAGRPLSRDAEVYQSERDHGARNRVIAHLMKHFGLITGDVESALDAYFAACSISVTCVDLARMAACLASGGRNPATGERVLPPAVARTVLTVMTTCGMYDASGRFAWEVGLPAKSGVAGGIVALVPGRYGFGVYSPRLDASGNSVRGWAALRRLARDLDGHLLSLPGRRSRIAPASLPLQAAVTGSYQVGRAEAGGRPADYLPWRGTSSLAIAVCTVEGETHEAGDADEAFSVQAVANPLALGHALVHIGERRVRRVVGEEPSGNPFHAIVIDRRRGRPFNAMGNAGAIAIASLNWQVEGFDPAAWMASLSGGGCRLVVDEAVLAAERGHAHRNYAIASFLREAGVIDDPTSAVDLYLRQCATMLTVRDLARIGATLATGGVRVDDGRRVISQRAVTRVLTVMYTCGMHDHSGQFALDVGIPAKSGVSGCILAVVPGVMGIAVSAPRVDEVGTSVPGHAALGRLSQDLGLVIPGGYVDG